MEADTSTERAVLLIRKARLELVRDSLTRPISTLLISLVHEVTHDETIVDTAKTNLVRVTYNAAFINKAYLDGGTNGQKVVNFIVAHEAIHAAFLHPIAKAGVSDRPLWPVAADLFVNNFLREIDPTQKVIMQPPTFGVQPMRSVNGWSVVQILRKLEEMFGSGGSGGPKDAPHANHQFVDKDVQRSQEQQKRGMQNALGNLKAQLARRGTLNAEQALMFESGQATVDWRGVFKNAVNDAVGRGIDHAIWHRPHRRMFAAGVLLPRAVGSSPKRVVLIADTSGSFVHRLDDVCANLASLSSQVQVLEAIVLWTETTVTSVQRLTPAQLSNAAAHLKPVGGGGTDMRAGFFWCQEEIKKGLDIGLIVTLTDGETPWPERPVLGKDGKAIPSVFLCWDRTPQHQRSYGNPPFGVTIDCE